jgi:hypothetical protein
MTLPCEFYMLRDDGGWLALTSIHMLDELAQRLWNLRGVPDVP